MLQSAAAADGRPAHAAHEARQHVSGTCAWADDGTAAAAPLLSERRRVRGAAVCVELAAAGGACYAFDYAFHNIYCAVLFRCHCTWPWAGGASACNIHHRNGPRCPWCAVRSTGLAWLAWAITDAFTVAMMLCSYAVVVLCQSQPLRRGSCDRACHPVSRRQVAARCLTPLLVFLLLGFAMGLTFYLGTDYPCFLWIYDDATECGWKAGFNASVRSVG